MYLCGFGAEWLFASIFTYFVIFVLQHDPAMVAGLNSLNSILQLISTALFIGLCVKKGFQQTLYPGAGDRHFRGSAVYLAVVFPSTVRPGDSADVRHYRAVRPGYRRGLHIPWTVYTFLADVDEIYTGRRREGIYAGAMTFSGKILRSIVVFSMGAILSFYGFQSKAHSQPESAVTAIAVVFCVGVIALALAAIVFSKQMKLDRKAHLVVLQEVARIKAGGKISDIAPDVRVIVEDLVGHRYEECWGNSKLFKDAAPAPAQTVVSH